MTKLVNSFGLRTASLLIHNPLRGAAQKFYELQQECQQRGLDFEKARQVSIRLPIRLQDVIEIAEDQKMLDEMYDYFVEGIGTDPILRRRNEKLLGGR